MTHACCWSRDSVLCQEHAPEGDHREVQNNLQTRKKTAASQWGSLGRCQSIFVAGVTRAPVLPGDRPLRQVTWQARGVPGTSVSARAHCCLWLPVHRTGLRLLQDLVSR